MKIISSIIYQLHSQGLYNRQIAKKIGCHHNTVSYYLKKRGLSSNFANQPIDRIGKNKARCRKCHQIKSISEFQYGRKGQKYEYRFSYCNSCRKQQIYLSLNRDVDRFLSDRYSRLVRRARKNRIDCTISKQEFIKQFHRQRGLCFYTNVPLRCKVGEGNNFINQCSVDRIIRDKGYILGNTVFCSNRANTSKNSFSLSEIKRWMPYWYKKIMKFSKWISLKRF